MHEYYIELDKKNISLVLFFSILSSVIIMLIHNFNIDPYLKYFILPITILIISYSLVIKLFKEKINKKALILLLPIFLILISNVIVKVDDSNLIINLLILPILLSMFFFSSINSNYKISRTIGIWLLKLFPVGLFENLDYIKTLNLNIGGKNKDKIRNIIIGLCIGIPIALILISLLTSADKYFSVFIETINNSVFNTFDIGFLTGNIVVLVIFFVVFFSILINIYKHKDDEDIEINYFSIDKSISKTILIVVNLVFVLFIVSEISKITVNFLSLPIEYTFAEYAREGFFQLLFVTVINFAIILYYTYFTKDTKENKIIKYLLITLISFSIMLIFNSYYRMFLYISNYGFTILRLQVVFFLFMELILFFVILKKIINELKMKDSILFTLIIIYIYILNIYLCTQSFIDYINKL